MLSNGRTSNGETAPIFSALPKVTTDAVFGDPEFGSELLRCNLERLGEAAWPIFAAGHIPMIGEWVALPVLSSAGATGQADPLAAGVMYPVAHRLLQRCDAVLRLPGESRGADQDVAIAHERGIPVYTALAEVPGVSDTAATAV